MELVLQSARSTNTGAIDVTVDANVKQFKSPPGCTGRTIIANCTAVGAISATVYVYQVTQRKWKRLIATLTLTQAAPQAAIDILNPGTSFVAEIVFTANPSTDTVDVVVEG